MSNITKRKHDEEEEHEKIDDESTTTTSPAKKKQTKSSNEQEEQEQEEKAKESIMDEWWLHKNSFEKAPKERVQEFFDKFQNGDYKHLKNEFDDCNGRQLLAMREDDFLRRAPKGGDYLFNDIQALKPAPAFSRVPLIAPVIESTDHPLVLDKENNLGASVKFITVSHVDVGVRKDLKTQTLYVRNEWRSLWKRLCSEKNNQGKINNMLIRGAPGTGKSSVVWAWCCWYAKQGHRVRWVRLPTANGAPVKEIFLDKDSLSVKHYTALDFLPHVQSPYQFEVTVLDGYHTFSKVQVLHNVRMILVASNRVSFSSGNQVVYNWDRVDVSGWLPIEFLEASQCDSLWNSVQENLDAPDANEGGFDDDLAQNQNQNQNQNQSLSATLEQRITMLRNKYYYAGGSARFMFQMNTETLIQQLNDSLRRAHDPQVIISDSLGEASEHAVNSLRSSIWINNDLKYITVSKFVSFRLVKNSTRQFIVAATAHASALYLRSFDDWVLQMDILERIMHEKHIDFVNSNEVWKKSQVIEINVVDDLKKERFETFQDCWIVPLRENQAGFDVLQLTTAKPWWDLFSTPKKILRVIQITRAKRHSLKIEFVAPFWEKLKDIGFKADVLEIVAIVPRFNDVKFPGKETVAKKTTKDFDYEFDVLFRSNSCQLRTLQIRRAQ